MEHFVKLVAFVSKPFLKSHRKSGYLSTLVRKQYHIDPWNAYAINLINKIENPVSTISGRTQSQSKENHGANIKI